MSLGFEHQCAVLFMATVSNFMVLLFISYCPQELGKAVDSHRHPPNMSLCEVGCFLQDLANVNRVPQEYWSV